MKHLSTSRIFISLVCFSSFIGLIQFPLISRAAKLKSKSSESHQLLVELTGKDPAKATEAELYSEFVSACRTSDIEAVKLQAKSFLSRFPQSAYADNVLFLMGRTELSLKNYSDALKNFQKVIEQYPNSNKAVSAMFAKAMAYQQMHLPEQAKLALGQIKTKYPGSPESFRADNQLKMLEGVLR